MKVKLLHSTPLFVCSTGVRTCWDSHEKSDKYYDCPDCGEDHIIKSQIEGQMYCPNCNTQFITKNLTPICGVKDKELIDRVGNKFKHSSVLNHITYNFYIEGISTKTLLALTRHDEGTEFSVQSSRYTCKKSNMQFTYTKDNRVNKALIEIQQIIEGVMLDGGSCDDIAMLLPQAYQYTLTLTMSIQALQHFLKLRLEKDAHWDIRKLANKLFDALPEDHKYLFKDCIK